MFQCSCGAVELICSAGFARPGNQAVRLWGGMGYLPENYSAERRCRAYRDTGGFRSQARVRRDRIACPTHL